MGAKKHHPHRDCDYRIYLTNLFRKLWEQHVMWTRSFIISTAANLGDLELVTQRLLRNPVDIAEVLRWYYGAQPAGEFERLLTAHLTIAGQLVTAAKQGDDDAVTDLRRQWYANADTIAAFLAELNPCWIEEWWRSMLYEHLELTEQEAIHRLNGDYAKDIDIYDKIEEEALKMADEMANGIIRQFGF